MGIRAHDIRAQMRKIHLLEQNIVFETGVLFLYCTKNMQTDYWGCSVWWSTESQSLILLPSGTFLGTKGGRN